MSVVDRYNSFFVRHTTRKVTENSLCLSREIDYVLSVIRVPLYVLKTALRIMTENVESVNVFAGETCQNRENSFREIAEIQLRWLCNRSLHGRRV